MNKKLGALAFLGAAALVLAGCSGGAASTPTDDASGFDADGAKDQDITFWVMGGDTPEALRDYLVTEYEDDRLNRSTCQPARSWLHPSCVPAQGACARECGIPSRRRRSDSRR